MIFMSPLPDAADSALTFRPGPPSPRRWRQVAVEAMHGSRALPV